MVLSHPPGHVSAPRIYAVLNSRHNQSLDFVADETWRPFFFPELPAHCRISRSSHGEPEKSHFYYCVEFPQDFEAFPEHSFLELFRTTNCQFCHHHMDCNAVANILSTLFPVLYHSFLGNKAIINRRPATSFLLNLPAQRPIFARQDL
ncbi:Uncharacterised protein [Escherichia coli]|uniref:Uncharacterized protein n=1 Tax=Escherichia coli TaxID=562 RepID=A0A376U1S6_ECOLX|nr:Uncharacterised protein [Escherichia coli]